MSDANEDMSDPRRKIVADALHFVKPDDCEYGYCVCCWSSTVHTDRCVKPYLNGEK